MIAVILAAGIGRRIGRDRPKALLEVGGRTLLDRHLENLAWLGIEPLVVTGFRAELFGDVPTAHNERYADGSLRSLQVGLEAVGGDVVVMDADVLYDRTILADVVALDCGWAIDPRSSFGDEEMMLGVRDGRLRAMRRGELSGFDLVGEDPGFGKFDAASVPELRRIVDDILQTSDGPAECDAAYHAFLEQRGADYVLVGDRPWVEIDFPEDLQRAREVVLPAVEARLRSA